ncbi:MAG: hypothetical protein LBE91_15605 [Tannerella sp.]|jgi:hypothetical protein|nr:hypothetical protein [Tannerella sp.]
MLKVNKIPYFCGMFDEFIYTDLREFLFGEEAERESLSFLEVIEKINSYQCRPELRVGIIYQTISKLLDDISEKPDTPFFLDSYLCREIVRSAVLRKFSNLFGSEYSDIQSLSYKLGDNVTEAVDVFNSLKICNPAVGDGSLMCILLDETVALKSQIGILTDRVGNPLFRYKVMTGENGLVVLDKKEFKLIELDGTTEEARYIQESLFYEKIILLKNSLFGTEYDSKNVLIAKLRLWLNMIVSLRGMKNIDLQPVEANILCGDALVSRFTLKDDLLEGLRNINQSVYDYKRLAEKIKAVYNLDDHHYLSELMTLIKNRLIEGIGWYSKDTEELTRLRKEIAGLLMPGLFPLTEKETKLRNEKVLQLHNQIKKQEQNLTLFRHHQAFDKSIEWRYDFPELLDMKGNFTGFDALVGELPYASIQGIGDDNANIYKRMNYKVFKRTGYISDLYCELANRLLVHGGKFVFLMPSNWRRDDRNSRLGEYLSAEMNPLQIIVLDSSDKCAVTAQKDLNRHHTMSVSIDKTYDSKIVDIETYIKQNSKYAVHLSENISLATEATTREIISSNVEYLSIRRKIKQTGLYIKNWDVNIHSGITTGFDDAFLLNREEKETLIHLDYKNTSIIKPLLSSNKIHRYSKEQPEKWILYIPWHFPLQFDNTITSASERAETRFGLQYPDIYAHLSKFKKPLSLRNAMEIGIGFEWYALQQTGAGNNSDPFTDQKIVWKKKSPTYDFIIDYEGCAVLEDSCFMTGQHLKFLLGVFNSSMGKFMIHDLAYSLKNENQDITSVLESISVPVPDSKSESDLISLVNRRISQNENSTEALDTDHRIDSLVYELYGLSEEEKNFIATYLLSIDKA